MYLNAPTIYSRASRKARPAVPALEPLRARLRTSDEPRLSERHLLQPTSIRHDHGQTRLATTRLLHPISSPSPLPCEILAVIWCVCVFVFVLGFADLVSLSNRGSSLARDDLVGGLDRGGVGEVGRVVD